MSKFDSDDLERTGYFLPEDSQFRLKKLREYVQFLSHLAQPRKADEEQEWIPEIRVGEVAICLELLAEQLSLVLDDISWPAERGENAAVPGADAEPEAMKEASDGAGGRYLFGVTLEQVEMLSRLIEMISAHGEVVTASDDAGLADHTLSLLGDAIFGGVSRVREIIRQVESQRLDQAHSPQTGVGEERAVYHAKPGRKKLNPQKRWAIRGRRKLNALELGFGACRSTGPAQQGSRNGGAVVFPDPRRNPDPSGHRPASTRCRWTPPPRRSPHPSRAQGR